MKLNDPFETVKAVTVHYAAADKLPDDGRVAGVKGARSAELKVTNQTAGGTLALKTDKSGVTAYCCQASATGLTAGRPVTFHLNFRGDIKIGDLVALSKRYETELHFPAFSPDGKSLLLAKDTPGVDLFDLESGWKATTVTEHKKPGNFIAFSPDGKHLATGGMEGVVRIWDLATRTVVKSFPVGDELGVNSLAWSPDGKMLAVGRYRVSGDHPDTVGKVTLWDVAGDRKIADLLGHGDESVNVAFNSDGTLLASAGKAGSVRVWHVASQKEIARLDNGRAGGWVAVTSSVRSSPPTITTWPSRKVAR